MTDILVILSPIFNALFLILFAWVAKKLRLSRQDILNVLDITQVMRGTRRSPPGTKAELLDKLDKDVRREVEKG